MSAKAPETETVTYPRTPDTREAAGVRVEKSEQPTHELCRFDRLVKSSRVHQWSLKNLDN